MPSVSKSRAENCEITDLITLITSSAESGEDCNLLNAVREAGDKPKI